MKALIFLSLIFSIPVWGGDYIDLPATTFEAKATNIYDRINDIINNPEPVLIRYRPVGMKVKDKVITHNQIQFLATKEVLGVSRTVLYKGTLDISYVDGPVNQKCFRAFLDFNDSGDLIIDNIESLDMLFCTYQKAPGYLGTTVKSKLKKGPRYGGLIGAIAKNLIADQVDPIIASVKEEIEKDNE